MKFTRLKFNIHGRSEEEIRQELEPLRLKYKEVDSIGNSPYFLSIMCYLIYLNDPGTDLNQEYFRLEDRRNKAAELSGLTKIKDLSLINKILDNSMSNLMDIIQVLFTQVYHDRKYREWQTLHHELDEYTRIRWQKVDRVSGKNGRPKKDAESEIQLKDKGKLRIECKEIHELLDQLERDIFADHDDLKTTAYKSRFLSPESWSLAISKSV